MHTGKLLDSVEARAVAASTYWYGLPLRYFYIIWKQSSLRSSLPLLFWYTCESSGVPDELLEDERYLRESSGLTFRYPEA